MTDSFRDYGLDTSRFINFAWRVLSEKDTDDVLAFLDIIRIKSEPTYQHSMRVAMLAAGIGRTIHFGVKPLFYAGLLHDVGKVLVPTTTLHKTDGWTAADSAALEPHVDDGFALLRDRFDFTAEIIARHHQFQPNCYPDVLPPHLHPYKHATGIMIAFYGRLLALADSFDAYHRINSRGALTGVQIHEKILDGNPDLRELVEELYRNGTFLEVWS